MKTQHGLQVILNQPKSVKAASDLIRTFQETNYDVEMAQRQRIGLAKQCGHFDPVEFLKFFPRVLAN